MPHSGHLYLIYAYGMIVYACYLFVFFWRRKQDAWSKMLHLIPLFACFSVNVGLIDARYTFASAVIFALGQTQPIIHPTKKQLEPPYADIY